MAGEPEPVVFGCSEPGRLMKKPGAGNGAAKKTGAGAAQKKTNQEPEPEPPKLGGSGSFRLII